MRKKRLKGIIAAMVSLLLGASVGGAVFAFSNEAQAFAAEPAYNIQSTGVLHVDDSAKVTLSSGLELNTAAADFTSVELSGSDSLVLNNIDFSKGYKRFMGMVSSADANSALEFYDNANDELLATMNVGITAQVGATALGNNYTPNAFEAKYATVKEGTSGVKNVKVVAGDGSVNIDWLLATGYTGSDTKEEIDARLAWWDESRFGEFIHYGPYAVLGGYYNGQSSDYSEWIMHNLRIPKAEYENVASSKFNPENWNAKSIVDNCVAAGQKYLVITSKHHDGFSIYDTHIRNFVDYSLLGYDRSAYVAAGHTEDIIKELADECHKQGVKFGFYYTIMDWGTPHQTWGQGSSATAEGTGEPGHIMLDKAAYNEEMKGQLRELIEYYDADVLWFDGEWKDWWTREDGKELYNYLRAIKPKVVVNNRVGKRHDEDGDFGTPEQEIPATGMDIRWESCMTHNNSWGYHATDNNWKSVKNLLDNLVDTASKGGNLLLNIGPMADGTVPTQSVTNLLGMGEWLNVYGETIYGTHASIFSSLPSGVKSTTKGNTVNLFLSSYPTGGELTIPAFTSKIKSIKFFGDNTELEYDSTTAQTIIKLPATAPDALISVIQIETEGQPSAIVSGNIARGATYTCSGEYDDAHSISAAFDGAYGGNSRWADKDNGKSNPSWLQIDFGTVRPFSEIYFDECVDWGERIDTFVLKISSDGTNWTTLKEGSGADGKSVTVNGQGAKRFSWSSPTDVSARYVRLDTTRLTENGLSIWEFAVIKEYGSVAITSPANGSIQYSSPLRIAGTSRMAASVSVNIDGYDYETTLNPNSGEWFYDMRGIPQGAVTIKAIAKNAAGEALAIDKVNFEMFGTTKYGDNLAQNKGSSAKASSYITGYAPSNAFDENGNTRWAPQDSDKTPWILLDLGSEQTFNTILVAELYDEWSNPALYRTENYAVQYSIDAKEWKTAVEGKDLGRNKVVRFAPVTGRYFRLVVTKPYDYKRGAASFYEIMIFNSDAAVDTSVTSLQVNGVAVAGFSKDKLVYDVAVSSLENIEIDASATDGATVMSVISGETVYVTAQGADGTDKVYTLTLRQDDGASQGGTSGKRGCKSSLGASSWLLAVGLLGVAVTAIVKSKKGSCKNEK